VQAGLPHLAGQQDGELAAMLAHWERATGDSRNSATRTVTAAAMDVFLNSPAAEAPQVIPRRRFAWPGESHDASAHAGRGVIMDPARAGRRARASHA